MTNKMVQAASPPALAKAQEPALSEVEGTGHPRFRKRERVGHPAQQLSLNDGDETQKDQSDKAQDQHAIFAVSCVPRDHRNKPSSQYDPQNRTVKTQVPRACSHRPSSNGRYE